MLSLLASLSMQCLWSPLAFAIGCTYVAQWELKQVGLQWSNINQHPNLDDHFSFLGISTLLALDLFLYLLIAWYLEGVFPGRYGVAKPWYFPLMPSYWCGQRQQQQQHLCLHGAHCLMGCARPGISGSGSHQILLDEGIEMISEQLPHTHTHPLPIHL